MSRAEYRVGDVFEKMADIPDGSIDAVICSPPFLALRSYLPSSHPDKGKEIGSEATPADFLTTLLALTVEWRRVLAPHGSLCVELGDTYSGSGGAGGDYGDGGMRDGAPLFDGSAARLRTRKRTDGGQYANHQGEGTKYNEAADRPIKGSSGWPLDKSLCLLPTLYPASLAYGRNLLTGEPCEPWRIRNQIVWHRPNPPVGALGDKVRPSTSYITVACTSRTRWFDLDSERNVNNPDRLDEPAMKNRAAREAGRGEMFRSANGRGDGDQNPAGAPPLDCWLDTTTDDVWTIPTQPYKGSHYATFPITLPRKLINLMCPRQVCRWCGEPRRRLTENPNEGHGANMWNRHGTAAAVFHKDIDRPHNSERTTLGWSDCGHNTWRRGIVLDPFAGSGTTLVAASELGRDSIGIDIDERNHELARERCGMFLVEEEVVNVVLPVERTCGYMNCTNKAEFYGPLWSSLDHDETYVTYACQEHTDGMAIVRHLGYPVTDQPPGFPIYTERPA